MNRLRFTEPFGLHLEGKGVFIGVWAGILMIAVPQDGKDVRCVF